ncbi:ABC transporter substrate-binding protein [Alsobacter metallidurans]|uniref:ABC transporter substrate-binding protein n=1 Tax=Alsobacter metallidurans TaxID=340221 RepID=A0A917I302_9HYPH|nr:transporter substrate-binding domain-containing protein [Alsobacter metallidurans]GGH07259.1 ABC transporter substrate-binding protein [Alsobacter metallidurans]
MRTFLKAAVLGLGLAIVSAGVASAQNLLDDIIKRGVINVGVSLGTPPYGLTNSSMEPDGYDVELAKLIARDLGVKINIVDTVASNRIPNLTSNKLDLVISSFSITPERAKAIAFTNTVYVDQQVLLAPKDNKFASLADLKGKKIGVTRSTTNDIALTKRAVEGTAIQRYDDDASTSQALLAGQVDGIVTSGGLAQVFSQKSPNLETKFPVASAPMGLGIRRGEHDFLHWLNTDIFMLWTTGEIQALQKKWMGAANPELPRF